jgi:hypothetical protein
MCVVQLCPHLLRGEWTNCNIVRATDMQGDLTPFYGNWEELFWTG